MFPRALTLFRVRGIPIRVDPSLILIGLLVVWVFLSRFTTTGRSAGTAVAMAITGALLFFASILTHELGHALEARHREIKVHGVTLFLFGGVTEMHVEARRPRDEFVVAIVGPWLSLVAAACFGLIATGAAQIDGSAARAVGEVAGLLGWLNLALGVFNLIPGAPLDGGRVLRALLWAIIKDRHRATRWAARSGQAVAFLLIYAGVSFVIRDPERLLVSGIWFGLIGWFLFQGAQAEIVGSRVQSVMEGRTAGSLVTLAAPRTGHDRSLTFVADELAAAPGFDLILVTEDGRVTGVVSLEDVSQMHPMDREFRAAGELARPIEELPVIDADEELATLVRAVQEHDLVAVTRDGEIVTVLGMKPVAAALDRLDAIQRSRRRRTPTGAGG